MDRGCAYPRGPNVADEMQRTRDDSQSWKKKMGVEFSGFQWSRDFVVAFLFGVVFVAIAMTIAYLAFE